MDCVSSWNCKKIKNGNCPLLSGEDSFCIKKFKIDNFQNNALLTDSQRQHKVLRLDSTKADKDAFTQLSNIEKNIGEFVLKGENLYIFSTSCGNGKTSWGLRLLNSYFESIWYKSEIKCKGLFINVPKFLLALKDNISQKSDYIQFIKDNVLEADLVVWDDIGTKGFTEFEMENVLNIINFRLDSKKSNIYTSNLSGEVLRQSIGDRLYSRVFNSSTPIELREADKRGMKA